MTAGGSTAARHAVWQEVEKQEPIRCVSGDLKIGFALTATNDFDNGGCRFRAGTGLRVWVGLRKKLKEFGFYFFSLVLVHQIFFFVFLGC
ncbi:hypothetical protein [Desulfosarcina sp.]|uniref:hypothetical protein n=1 Tax=Desulfosarcina sp. TaxID=2027861 RepID=UPI00356B3D88